VILGDVDPQEKRFGKEQQENLARYVREGGLIVIAGSHSMPHAWKKTALAECCRLNWAIRRRRNA